MGRFRSVSRAFERLVSRLLGRVRPTFVCHPAYQQALPGVPLDPLRAQRILAYLLDEGLLGANDISLPIAASLENIARVHSSQYLERLDLPECMDPVLGFRVDPDLWQRLIDVQRIVAGGTIQATRLALRTGSVSVNLSGGFHHATPDRGMGFCILNDIAVAVRRLRAKGFAEPVLIVDLDIHDGNGTRLSFAEDPTVYTLSIHSETWDRSPALADTCIALGPDVTDDSYLETVRDELPRVAEAHRPALVLYVAGVDVAADDVLGNWELSPDGVLERDRYVVEQFRSRGRGTPLVILLGGGYGDKAWRHSARFLAWVLSGESLNPTEDIDSVVRRFRRVQGGVLAKVTPKRPATMDWALKEEDLQVFAPPDRRDARVLGAYTRYGIELLLERLGILNQLRAKGFMSPVVTVHIASPLGHTISVYGDPDRSELLMELRLRRDRATIPEMEMLYAEWLLLQNPREDFRDDRPQLPGQRHPGLGLLREIVAVMVVMCEQQGLDGILFVPAHYYMAVLGRRHMAFVRPEDAALFEAMRKALAGRTLAEATRAIEDGAVLDTETRSPVAWHTPLMALAASERLRQHLARCESASATQAPLVYEPSRRS